MGSNQVVERVTMAVDVAVALGYAAASTVEICRCGLGEYHDINYAGDPSAVTAFVNNTPNGSRIYDTTNGKLYIKLGPVGSGVGGSIVAV